MRCTTEALSLIPISRKGLRTMNKKLPRCLFPLAVLCIVVVPNAWSQNDETTLKKASHFSAAPVLGDFQNPQNDPNRKQREQRYGTSGLPRKVDDSSRLVNGKLESTQLRIADTVMVDKPGETRGIPASVSTLIVVGTVVSGKAFFNDDHTYVYSDYSVRVDQILKPDASVAVIPGDMIVAAHEGGAIHFPSGHVTNFVSQGHGFPEIGSQYILFLWKSISTLPEYEMVFNSGYQLKDGRVYPLDDDNSQFTGIDATEFLGQVQKAIARRKGAGS